MPALPFRGMPGHLFRRMNQAALAVFDREVAAAGHIITSVQFAALTTIAIRPGLDQTTLAATIVFDRPTTGGVVDRLEAKGLVRREIDKSDRRARRLFIEPAGERVLAEITPAVERAQRVMLQGLSGKEADMLMRLLAKALTTVGDITRPSNGAARKS